MHNKIINAAARTALKPLGLRPKGASRTWIDDHGWWLVQVEFQPRSGSKGSYLNVGVCWLLYESGFLGFDVGYRTDAPFIEYRGDEQFIVAAQELAQRAASEVEKLRRQFRSLSHAVTYYKSSTLTLPWDEYYAGVLSGLAGRVSAAKKHLERVAALPQTGDFEKGLTRKARDFLPFVGDPDRFSQMVIGTVYRARSAANLSNWEGELSF